MKPFRSFLFFLSVLGCIVTLSLVFPGSEVLLTEKMIIKIPDLRETFQAKPKTLIDPLWEDAKDQCSVNALDSLGFVPRDPERILSDNAVPEYKSRSGFSHFIFPGNDTTLLYPFFEKLKQVQYNKGGLRILYYGDSQIEGDRITAHLRKKLQSHFGGTGPGLISPRMVVSYTLSVNVTGSSNWRRYTLNDLRESIISKNRFGVLLNYCSFTAPYEMNNSNDLHSANIKIGPARMGYENSEIFQVCRIFADDVVTPLYIEIRSGNRIIHDTIPTGAFLHEFNYFLQKPGDQTEIYFRAKRSPRIYGIALDDTTGLAIDNIPLRGSQGMDFSKTDTNLLREMYQQLNVGLIILHFGVNVAMNEVDDYTYYENGLLRELSILKDLSNAPVLIIGISDMFVDGGARELPNLEKIRQAQIRATRNGQGIYYDLYTYMGGQGSMKDWVGSEPPLARSDHIHFTRLGADHVAQMLYEAIMHEYSVFELKR